MKITFIRPRMSHFFSGDAMEPLIFAILKSLTPENIECVFYDERIEDLPFDEATDLVALTVETFTAKRAYQIAFHYKKRGIPVVLGGYHPTLCPEEALSHADSIVIGDAEKSWPLLLEDFLNRKLKPVYQHPVSDLQDLRFDRSIYAHKRYPPVRLVQFGRGCRFACDFCSIHAFYGKTKIQRPVSRMVEELRSLKKKHVFITDDNLFTHPDQMRELLTALIPLKIHWSCQMSLDIVNHPDLVELMAQSGCSSVLIGFESLNPLTLKQIGKSWNMKYGDYSQVVRLLNDAGISIYGTFVFGYDDDTEKSFDRTLEFALESRLFLGNFNPLVPTPGTRLYARLQKEKRLLLDPWWLHPDYRYGQAVFHPAKMSAEALERGCFETRKKFYSYANIWKRLTNLKRDRHFAYHLGLFLAVNHTSRREILRKQGQKLGRQGEELFSIGRETLCVSP